MFKINQYKSHYHSLIVLGFPIIVGQLGTIAQGFADTLMIGRHGSLELSAAGFVNGLFALAIIFGMGFSYGLTPVAGALFGKGEKKRVGGLLKSALLANLLLSFIVTAIMTVVYLNIDRMGQPVEIIGYIRPYFLILLVSLIPVQLFYTFKQFTDSINKTSIGMWIIIVSNLFNIAGNYVFIYGKLGFPELGLLGAGIATTLSRFLMVFIYLAVILFSPEYADYRRGFTQEKVNKIDFRQMNAMGWPLAFQMGTEAASFSLAAVMMGWIGSVALAAHQVLQTISQFCFLIYYGLGAAVAIRVSNFMGLRDWVNVRRNAYAGFHLMLIFGFLALVLILVFRAAIVGWFTTDEQIIRSVFVLMIPFACYQFGDVLQTTFANALRGTADVKMMMKYAFIAYICVSLPVSYFFGFILDWGGLGVWMGFPFGLTTAGALFFLRFRRRVQLLVSGDKTLP